MYGYRIVYLENAIILWLWDYSRVSTVESWFAYTLSDQKCQRMAYLKFFENFLSVID